MGENAYLSLCRDVLNQGSRREDRTGTGTLSLFGARAEYDLREGFPLITTRRINWRAAFLEILWMCSGSNRIEDLGCGIWDSWALDDGTIGGGYGVQMRCAGKYDAYEHGLALDKYGGMIPPGYFGSRDQLYWLLNELRANPYSRRLIVSYWQVEALADMALPPCHMLWQVYVDGPYLDMQLSQRSADLPVGVPFNVAGYALLLELLAKEAGLTARRLIHSIGDAHVYLDQVEGMREQVSRQPLSPPRLKLPDVPFWDTIERRRELLATGDLGVVDYQSHTGIKYPVAV